MLREEPTERIIETTDVDGKLLEVDAAIGRALLGLEVDEKRKEDYSPTTLYNDYAISPTRFHWETQSNCHAETSTGRRYLRAVRGAKERVLLFVRQKKADARGVTMPYVFLGQAFCATHRGGRPMQIEWDLERAMPAGFFQETKIAAG